jgi:DNA polymerase III epsilon subunit-like protein
MVTKRAPIAISFKEAQKKVADIIKDRILVGHAVYNDLKALMLDHPRILIRDTSRYKPFRKHSKGRTPGLKLLVKEVLSISIQSGSHSSVSIKYKTIYSTQQIAHMCTYSLTITPPIG